MRKKPNALHSKVPQEQKFAEYVVDQGMQVVTFRTQTTSQKLLFANLSQEIQPKVPEKFELSRRDDSILLAFPFVFWKTRFRFQVQNLRPSYNKTIYKKWSFRHCCQNCLGNSNVMQGILFKLLPVDNLMESCRPMFTERHENHNVTSGKTAITSYLVSKVAVPITKPRYFDTVIPLQALSNSKFDRGTQTKS